MSTDEHILAALGKTAEHAGQDPEAALAWARRSAEDICSQMLAQDVGDPGPLTLEQRIATLEANRLLPGTVARHLHTVRAYGSFGVHAPTERTTRPTDGDSELIRPCIAALAQVSRWYFQDHLLRARLPEVVLDLSARAARGLTAPPDHAAQPPDGLVVADSPVVTGVGGSRTLYLHISSGRWLAFGARPQLIDGGPRALAAATVDSEDRLLVASFECGVDRSSRALAWERIEHTAAVTALTACGPRVVAGDVAGELFTVDHADRERCALGAPVVALRALGATHVVALDADGGVHASEWPPREPPQRVRGEHGPAVALFDTGRADAYLVATRTRLERRTLGSRTAVSKALDVAVRTAVPLGHAGSRLCVVTDAGELILLDAALTAERPTLLRSTTEVVGACRASDGSALLWTATGELHVLSPALALRCIAEAGVTFAASDPNDADRVVIASSHEGRVTVGTRSLA